MATKAQKQHAAELKSELQNCGKMPLFEIEISEDDNTEYYIYNIEIDTDKAKMNAAYTKISIDIDPDFSLDAHLEALFDECYNDAWAEFQKEFLS